MQITILLAIISLLNLSVLNTPTASTSVCSYAGYKLAPRTHLGQIDSIYCSVFKKISSDRDSLIVKSYFSNTCFEPSKEEGFYRSFDAKTSSAIVADIRQAYSKRLGARCRILAVEYNTSSSASASFNALNKVYLTCRTNKGRGEKCGNYPGLKPGRIGNFVILVFGAEESPLLNSSIFYLRKNMLSAIKQVDDLKR